MSHRGRILRLPPNRVWRTYPGGRTLDELALCSGHPVGCELVSQLGAASAPPTPQDTHFAEDWIASTTRAVNRGREQIAEGVSQVRVGLDPTLHDFAQLLAGDPEYFLGAAHVRKYGAQPQLLVKYLDSGTRLHLQVHPTREFAQRVLGAPSGKTEAYYVLGVRGASEVEPDVPIGLGSQSHTSAQSPIRTSGSTAPDSSVQASTNAPTRSSTLSPLPPPSAREASGYIYVGFQRPPSPAELRDYIVTQNTAALEACFDRIPVQAGDTFIIPGGTPHALGAGVFMVEIQEPSDLVVRFEFERAGYVLPESARFMNRDVDFALSVFNLAPLSAADLEQRVRCRPRRLREFGAGSFQNELIGPAQTDCFRVALTHLRGPVVKDENNGIIAIVTSGAVMAEVGGESHRLDTYDKCFLPAGLGPVEFRPVNGPAEMLECSPPL